MTRSFVLAFGGLILGVVAVALFANGYLAASIVLAIIAAAGMIPQIRRQGQRLRP